MSQACAKVAVWKDICEKVSMEGQTEKGGNIELLKSMVVELKEGKAQVYGTGEGKAAFVHIEYKIDVKKEGAIPINSIEKFKKYLERFQSSDEVVVTADEKATKLVIERINPKKVVRVRLEPLEAVEESSGKRGAFENFNKLKFTDIAAKTDKFETKVKVTCDAKPIQEVMKDGDIVSRRIYPFVVENNVFQITVGDESSGVIVTDIPGTILGSAAKATYTTGLGGVISQIEGQCEIYFGDFTPLIVTKSDKEFKVQYIVLPNKKTE